MEWILGLGTVAIIAIIALQFAPKGYRTYILNVLSIVLFGGGELLEYMVGVPWAEFVDKQTAMAIVIGLNVASIIFRRITNGPPGQLGVSRVWNNS